MSKRTLIMAWFFLLTASCDRPTITLKKAEELAELRCEDGHYYLPQPMQVKACKNGVGLGSEVVVDKQFYSVKKGWEDVQYEQIQNTVQLAMARCELRYQWSKSLQQACYAGVDSLGEVLDTDNSEAYLENKVRKAYRKSELPEPTTPTFE